MASKPEKKKDDKPGFFKTITGAIDDVITEIKADVQSMTPADTSAADKKKREREAEAKRLAELVAQSTSGLAESIVAGPSAEPLEYDEEKPGAATPAQPKALTTLPTGNLWQALKDASNSTRLYADVCYHALTLADARQYCEAVKQESAAPFTLGILAVNIPALTEEELENPDVKPDPDQLTASTMRAIGEEARLYAAVGAGPRNLWSSLTHLDDHLTELLNENPKILALGPVGLDEPFAPYTIGQQKAQLALQLEIAHDFQLPVLLTNRKSHAALKDVLQGQGASLPRLVYLDPLAAEEDMALVEAFAMHAVLRPEVTMPDFPGAAFYRKLPPSRLLLACGSALVAPHGFSGHFNQPKFLQNTLSAAARFLGLKEHELSAATNRNLTSLFPQLS